MKLVARVTLHVRIANRVGEDSSCRGGIVHSRCGCSRALVEGPKSSTALWRFRVSTSNSLIGLSRPQTHTHLRQIDHTYVQQDIRVYEDDHMQPPKRQYPNPKALWRFRVSTSNSLNGRTWPLPNTPMCHIDHTYAQQDIRVYEDDHFEPPIRQSKNSMALYHFQITFTYGRSTRPSIPFTLFLLSRPLEQLEFIRFSNFPAEICFVPPTPPQRFILPHNFQSRYRRHLAH